ncbi:MAG: di-heme-cytochrome C peroxidase [Planctomycetota bacterium]|mgnify:CR=1 FL=1|nr:di-heme-cytochrome C peroxidase [Planctomycetota bacterium]MDA1252479.1 di-heme-cytochrome C peroxidase [Planctomycetota bacterium]
MKDPKELLGFLKRLEEQVISTNPDEPSLLAKFKNFDHLKGDGEFGAGLASHILQRVKSATTAIKTDAEHLALDAELLEKLAKDLLAKEHSGESPLEALEDTLEHSHLTDDLADLESALADIKYRAAFLKVRAWLSEPGNRLPAGYGRADDFGTARVELFAGWNKKNMVPVNAPVSTPQLWNVDEYAWLHWNANTNSVIQRSIGESIGVGATYNPKTLTTSVPISKQMHVEEQILKVLPPQWPGEIFGKPDQKKVAAGRTIFEEQCKGCHTPAGRDEKGLLEFNLLTVKEAGTDSLDATNFDRPVYKADDSTVGFAVSIETLLTELQTTQKKTMSDADKSLMDTLEAKRSPVKWRDTMTVTGGPVYPAKPLEGTWSTGPFLHNGSVPTMYHLLLPADQRPKKFFVGSNDFDPEKLGFHYETDETPSKYLKAFEFDATVKGNFNTGHEFGTDLSEEDRMALLEYLKTHKDNLDDIQNKFVPPAE